MGSGEGYIQNRRGAGYFVTDISFDALRGGADEGGALSERRGGEEPASQTAPSWRFDFSYGTLLPDSFPAGLWRKLTAEVLDRCPPQLTAYGDGQGDEGLRRKIARYLKVSRDVSCSADQVLITSGIQSSVGFLLSLFDPAEGRWPWMTRASFPCAPPWRTAAFPWTLWILPTATATSGFWRSVGPS